MSLNPSGNLKPTGSNFSAAIIAPNILYTGAENQELVSTSRNLGGSTLACRISKALGQAFNHAGGQEVSAEFD